MLPFTLERHSPQVFRSLLHGSRFNEAQFGAAEQSTAFMVAEIRLTCCTLSPNVKCVLDATNASASEFIDVTLLPLLLGTTSTEAYASVLACKLLETMTKQRRV